METDEVGDDRQKLVWPTDLEPGLRRLLAAAVLASCELISSKMSCSQVADEEPNVSAGSKSVDSMTAHLPVDNRLQAAVSAASRSCATVVGNGRAQRFREHRNGTDAQRAVIRSLGAGQVTRRPLRRHHRLGPLDRWPGGHPGFRPSSRSL